MGRYLAVWAVLAGAACTTSESEKQPLWRFTTFKQAQGERRLDAWVQFTNGSLRLGPTGAAELYRMELSYDRTRFAPVSTYDSATGALRIGTVDVENDDSISVRTMIGKITLTNRDDRSRQQATVALSPDVDAALKLELNTSKADVELGGLRVSTLDVTSDAGKMTLKFSKPNGIECRQASVSGGAGAISLFGLGNSRCRKITVQSGIGAVMLALDGAWTADAAIDATTAAGAITLRLPSQIGVRLTAKNVLADFKPNGLIRRGETFVSSNYDGATRRLEINLTTTVGAVTVEWIGE